MATAEDFVDLATELLARQLILVGGDKAKKDPRANDPYSIGYVFGLTEGLLQPSALPLDQKLQVIDKVFRATFGFFIGGAHLSKGLVLQDAVGSEFHAGRRVAGNEGLDFIMSKAMPSAWAVHLGSELLRMLQTVADAEAQKGDVIRRLGNIDQDREPERRAQTCREALTLFSREADPDYWVPLKRDLAVCLTKIEPATRARFDDALTHLNEALAAVEREQEPARWAELQHSLAVTKGHMAAAWEPRLLDEAFAHGAEAAATFAKVEDERKSARSGSLLTMLFASHQAADWGRGMAAIEAALGIARTKELLQLKVQIGAHIASSGLP